MTPAVSLRTHEQAQDAPASSAAVRAAIDVQAAVLSHADLQGAAVALVREIAARCGFDRVTLALADGARLDLLARSDSAAGGSQDLADAMLASRLLAALAEALDQRASLLVPEAQERAQPRITLAHRRLLELAGGSVASVPIMAAGSAVGALCGQRLGGRGITAQDLETLEHLACLAGPVLNLMRLNERPLRSRVLDRIRQIGAALRDPHRQSLRYATLGGLLLAAGLLLVPAETRVGGHARLEGAVQRALVAPADGFVHLVHARPGDSVQAGQTLIELAEQDLRLEQQRWQSQLAQYEGATAAANARADRPQLVINQSRAAEAAAQLELVDAKLQRGRIVAPFDGVVIQGDLSQSLGAPVAQGAELMTIAPRERFRVIVEVDERDIAAVQIGQGGTLALSALPWNTLPVRVKRITPMATALEGRNVFEVEAELLERRAELRPGLQGSARIVTGSSPLAWSATRRLVDGLRLAVWEWFG